MPTTNTSFVRSTAALLIVALVVLTGIVATTIWLVTRTQVYFDEVIQARTIRAVVIDLRNALQDAEIGQRGYLLTLNEAYLDPYDAARGRIPGLLDQFEELLSPYPAAAPALATLRPAIEAKLEELTVTIGLARGDEIDEAVEIVRTDAGKALMDQARLIFDGTLTALDEQLVTGVDSQRTYTNALRWVTIVGGLVILVVVGFAAWTVLRYTRELVGSRRLIERTNEVLEERVADRTADLARANEEVQRFAYIVTHDLRAPLVNIMGFTAELEAGLLPIQGAMERTTPTGDLADTEAREAAARELPEAIRFIRSSTQKMDRLINAILKISREGRRATRPEPIALTALIDNAAAAIQHQFAERGGSITIARDLPSIVSDRLSLEQIFGNLLDNAVKYADPSRPIEVSIRGGHSMGNRVFVEVADNGRGIAGEDHERVFELFRRSGDQTIIGEGIGLAHVRSLVRNLGGDVTLTSKLGTGTTFRVSLARDIRAMVGSSAN